MTALMREPIYADDVRQGALMRDYTVVSTKTAQGDGVLRNPGEFWSALDNDLKPAVVYSATMAVDLDVWVEAPLVLTGVLDVGIMPSREDQRARHITIGGTVRAKKASGAGKAREPVAGAKVLIPALGLAVESDRDGRFIAAGVPEGTHRVQVRIGDRMVEQELVVKVERAGQTAKEVLVESGKRDVARTAAKAVSVGQQYDLEV
jgi:hypothetical protein